MQFSRVGEGKEKEKREKEKKRRKRGEGKEEKEKEGKEDAARFGILDDTGVAGMKPRQRVRVEEVHPLSSASGRPRAW